MIKTKDSKMVGLKILNDMPLNIKFIFIYAICVGIPLLLTNLVATNQIVELVKDKELENMQIEVKDIADDISIIYLEAINVSGIIYKNESVHKVLGDTYETPLEYLEVFRNDLRDSIGIFGRTFDDIDNVKIYCSNDSILSGNGIYNINEPLYRLEKEKDWYKYFNSNIKSSIVFYAYKEKKEINWEKMSLIRRLENPFFGYEDGNKILRIDLSTNNINKVIKDSNSTIKIYLVDNLDRIVSSNQYRIEKEKEYMDINNILKDSNNIIYSEYFKDISGMENWRIVGAMSDKSLNRIVFNSRVASYALALVFLMIFSVLFIGMSRSYSYRLKYLSDIMRKAENQEYNLAMIDGGKDEIGDLIHSYNYMIDKINILINDVHKLELEKKDLEIANVKAELIYMHSQMNPHFIFNTLNAILVVCAKNNYTEVVPAIGNLAKLLRRMINWQGDFISINEEISFTKMYLDIEKLRFGDRFSYEINLDKEISRMMIPKMIIQPLVENACKHGIQGKHHGGWVKIYVALKDENIVITIIDNGIGIDDLKLNAIKENMKRQDESSLSIGLKNIYGRLKFIYKERMNFEIITNKNIGTEMIVTIPMDFKEE